MKKNIGLFFISIFIPSFLFSMPSAPAPAPAPKVPPQPAAKASFSQLKWPDTGVRLKQDDVPAAEVSKKIKVLQAETRVSLKKVDDAISNINKKRIELQDKFKKADEDLDKFLLTTNEGIGKQQGKVCYLNDIKK